MGKARQHVPEQILFFLLFLFYLEVCVVRRCVCRLWFVGGRVCIMFCMSLLCALAVIHFQIEWAGEHLGQFF